MKVFLFYACIILCFSSCRLRASHETIADNKPFAKLLDDYYEERIKFFPLEAVQSGDNRYNDLLPIEFTDSFQDSVKSFFSRNLNALNAIGRDELNSKDGLSYDIFKREMEISLEGLSFHSVGNTILFPAVNLTPFNQFSGLPLILGQMGSGTGIQPFKTINDYERWLKRASAFSPWTDSAIVYFRKGIAAHYVLPKALVVKMIDQMHAMVTDTVTKSLFYGPISLLPDSFSAEDKKRLTAAYVQVISHELVPSFRKLHDFLKNEYLPKARTSTGISSLANGAAYYNYLVRLWTTTDKTPEEIYETGLAEVTRIRKEMEKVKTETGFKGDLHAFFEFMKTDKRFTPYKSPQEVLDAFASIQKRIDPNLKKMFGRVPKTPFEIRQTEAFRAASASAEYFPGTADGSRPGIFYVPILDATQFNTTSGMESLFLHEAIPGHHYQMSLTQEDTMLPKFRRFAWYGAYGEGWALYCESLGKELGLYTDPYQYMGALGDEIHRAIRLVVDVGMHLKGMTREQAIQYMMDNEAISEQGAVAEIERYMSAPAQALSYKTGAMKIRELRSRYEKSLGSKFNLAAFHDEFLDGGCMPLAIVERKMDAWAREQK